MAMTSQLQYTRVDSLIEIPKNQNSCIYKQTSQVNAHGVNRAVCQILFSVDDMDPKAPLPALEDCSRILDEFEKDKEFIRLLQARIVKIVDKLIIPSLVLFINGNGATAINKKMDTENHANPKLRSGHSKESDSIQILSAACNIIEQLVNMIPYGMVFDTNVLEIVLDYLVTCFIISTSGDRPGEQKSYEVSIVDTIFCILENVTDLEQILRWFTSYSVEIQKDECLKLLMNSMLNYFLTSSKEHLLADPALMNLACKCIEQASGDAYKPVDFGSQLFEASYVLEFNDISSPRAPRLHPTNTVMVSPMENSPLVQEDSRYLRYISLKESKAPTPPWLDIFTQLTPAPSNSPPLALTTTTVMENNNFKPRHPHIESIKHIWHKVRTFCSSHSAIDRINRSHHHWGKSFSFCQAVDSLPKHTESLRIENRSITTGHQVPENMMRRKIDIARREKNHLVTKRKARIGKKRYQQRREPIKYRYHNVIKTSTFPNGQKLHYYYKLNKRSSYARRLQDCTFEKTYLGQIKGRTHGLQLRYQSKIEKLEYILRGYDK